MRRHLFLDGCFDAWIFETKTTPDNVFYQLCSERRFKTIYDNTWEMHRGDKGNRTHVLHNANWFWYNESLWYRDIGYDSYVPNKTYKKLGLMPMRRGRPHRDKLLIAMSPWLDDFHWSYTDHGRQLPWDLDPETDAQRYIHPAWFDDTHLSVIAETDIHTPWHQEIFITEKTFKAVAFEHPFLIWGNPKSLSYLRFQGFETFENLFDESYDHAPDDRRLQIIVDNVKNFNCVEYDNLTWQKLEHNRNWFYNRLIEQKEKEKEEIEKSQQQNSR